MKRRELLALTAVVPIAGCAGSDPDDTSQDRPESDEGESDSEPEADDTEDGSETDDPEPDQQEDNTDDEPAEDGVQATVPSEDVLEVSDLNVGDVEPDEEYVEFTNTADKPVDLTGAYIRDGEGGQIDRGLSPFRFPSGFTLGPSDSVRVWTGDGTNTETDLYWDYGVNMWNKEGDTVIVIYDDKQLLEHSY